MAKTIKELAKENIPPMGWYHFKDEAEECFLNGFEAGANTVLEEIETYLNNLNLGNSTEEKFYKLDVIADVGLYIKQLKGE